MSGILRLGGGLLLLIVANLLLGSVRAAIGRTWDKRVFFEGVVKAAIVVAAFALVYLAGWLNPELVVAEFEGERINLITAVYLALLGGFACYAVKVLKKLKEFALPKRTAEDSGQSGNESSEECGQTIGNEQSEEESISQT